MRPPAGLSCNRNQLTSYTGELRTYSRHAEATRISIRTDEGTDEVVVVPHRGTDPARAFLANGSPFRSADWMRLESAPGVAREGLRLSAWVCFDGHTPPLIDWQFAD